MFRKRKNPAPSFRMPPPFQPISGQHAALHASGLWPYCVLMQVAKADVHKNYCVCRGFDPRIQKFIDYEEGNEDKPGIPVAKPYGSRRTGLYEVAQIFAAALPIQSSDGSASPSSVYRVPPSPTTAPIRLGQNPGKASDGHPADLQETVEPLLTDEGKYINWMFLEVPSAIGTVARAKLAQDMCPDDCLVSVNCVRGTNEVVEQVSNWGFVGKSGDVIYITKIGSDAGSGSESGGNCDLECDQGSGSESGGTPEWEVISVTPRPLCPLSDVAVRDDCMVQIRSKMYGYECERDATATKIVDLTDCDEGSGSGSESGDGCDLSATWNLTCDEGSGSGS